MVLIFKAVGREETAAPYHLSEHIIKCLRFELVCLCTLMQLYRFQFPKTLKMIFC